LISSLVLLVGDLLHPVGILAVELFHDPIPLRLFPGPDGDVRRGSQVGLGDAVFLGALEMVKSRRCRTERARAVRTLLTLRNR
jgi:hypothetical protein